MASDSGAVIVFWRGRGVNDSWFRLNTVVDANGPKMSQGCDLQLGQLGPVRGAHRGPTGLFQCGIVAAPQPPEKQWGSA